MEKRKKNLSNHLMKKKNNIDGMKNKKVLIMICLLFFSHHIFAQVEILDLGKGQNYGFMQIGEGYWTKQEGIREKMYSAEKNDFDTPTDSIISDGNIGIGGCVKINGEHVAFIFSSENDNSLLPMKKSGEEISDRIKSQYFESWITGNDTMVFFCRDIGDGNGLDIYSSHKVRNIWSTPRKTDILNSKGNEQSVFWKPEVQELYFSRVDATGFYQIYVSNWENDNWGSPTKLPQPYNQRCNNLYYFESVDGTVYFSSDRAGSLQTYMYAADYKDYEFFFFLNPSDSTLIGYYLPYITAQKQGIIQEVDSLNRLDSTHMRKILNKEMSDSSMIGLQDFIWELLPQDKSDYEFFCLLNPDDSTLIAYYIPYTTAEKYGIIEKVDSLNRLNKKAMKEIREINSPDLKDMNVVISELISDETVISSPGVTINNDGTYNLQVGAYSKGYYLKHQEKGGFVGYISVPEKDKIFLRQFELTVKLQGELYIYVYERISGASAQRIMNILEINNIDFPFIKEGTNKNKN